MAEWWELAQIDPFDTLTPAGLAGLRPPKGLLHGQIPALRTDGQIVPGGPPGKIGPPSPPHPLSVRGLLHTAYSLSPFGAAGDLAEAIDDGARARTWGELLPAAGKGVLAAVGMVPGVGPALKTARAVKMYDRAVTAARKAGLDISPAARAKRMAEQGYNDQYWRGGADVADGAWYATHPGKAQNFDRGDVRQYALDESRMLHYDKGYGADLFRAIAKEVKAYNPAAAKEWREMAEAGEVVSGIGIWQMLQHTSNGPEALLRKLGFTSVDGGNEVRVLNRGVVRDAKHAMFNPAMRGKPNPFAVLLPPGAAAALGYGTGRSEDDRPW